MSIFEDWTRKVLPMFGGQARPLREQYKTANSFSQATTDYEQYLKDLKADSLEHIQSWSTDYAESGGKVGGGFRKPVGFPESYMAPNDEMGMYNQPAEWPGIASIVNLRRRR